MRPTTPPPTLPRRPLLGLWLALCLTALTAHAQSADAGDPPDRVARLSYVAGDVGFLPSGATDWSEASMNRPLTRGDRLSATDDARAELELDGGTLRIDGDTDFGFLQLDDQLAQVELTRGTLAISVRAIRQGQSYEIDTPTVALVVDQPGVFRVDVEDAGGTRVTAMEGQATVYGEGDAHRSVIGGHRYRFEDSALTRVDQDYVDGGDAFDRWSSERDRRYADSTSRQYVSEEVIGYQDLDRYGAWRSDANYGEVWYPSQVSAGWAPYRFGHWAYIAPWGWTWVDDAAWGFAPYHYGRWISIGGHWGWIPGPRALRPIYAPALVAFVGGRGWSVSVGYSEAPIGWFPLGPGEIYNPWYHASHRYYRDVNEHNLHWHRGDRDRHREISRIDAHYRHFRGGHPEPDRHYVNRDRAQGVTAVTRDTFIHARRVEHDRLRVDPNQLRRAPVLVAGNRLPPVRASLAPQRQGGARALPDSAFRRQVVARRAPPRSDPATAAIAGRVDPASRVRVLGRTAAFRPMAVPGATPGSLRERFPQATGAVPADALPSARFAPATRREERAATMSPDGIVRTARGARHEAAATPIRMLPAVPRIVRAEPEQRAAPDLPAQRFEPRATRSAAGAAMLPTPARIEAAGSYRPASRGDAVVPSERPVTRAMAATPRPQPVRRLEPYANTPRPEPRFERPRMVQTPRPSYAQPRAAAPAGAMPAPAARPAPARPVPAVQRQTPARKPPPAHAEVQRRFERQ